jgi:hypothetical protein
VSAPSQPGDLPLRVSTLELFFDLVFVFAITQLTGILSHDVSVAAGFRVLLIFGVPCVALGCGVALFLAGSAAFRHALRIGPERYRLAAAALALAVSAVGVTLSVAAEMALLTLLVAATLVVESRAAQQPAATSGGPGVVPPGASTSVEA